MSFTLFTDSLCPLFRKRKDIRDASSLRDEETNKKKYLATSPVANAISTHWSKKCNLVARAATLCYLQRLQVAMRLFPATLYYAVLYTDMILHLRTKRQLRQHTALDTMRDYALLSVASLYLAIKFNEIDTPSIDVLLQRYHRIINKQSIVLQTEEVAQTEISVWIELNYDLSSVESAWECACHLFTKENDKSTLRQSVDRIMQQFMLHPYWLQCVPSTLARSAYFLACYYAAPAETPCHEAAPADTLDFTRLQRLFPDKDLIGFQDTILHMHETASAFSLSL